MAEGVLAAESSLSAAALSALHISAFAPTLLVEHRGHALIKQISNEAEYYAL